MKALSITATAEGTGKTAISLALGRIAQDRGEAVGYMKPKGTRLQSRVGKITDRDPELAIEVLDLDYQLEELEPIVYSSRFIESAVRGQEDPNELRHRIQAIFDQLAQGQDMMLVEGATNHTVGQIIDLTDPVIAEVLDSSVLLVATFERLDDLDGLLAAIDDIGDHLMGILFNDVDDTALDTLQRDAIPFLESRGHTVLGVLPHTRELAGVTIGELATDLGAKQLTSDKSDAFIERFLVGAMSGDTALRHFRRTRNAAVITGGDRAEIHTAAIEAPGIECLILTGGQRPPSTIIGKAEEAGLSLLAVTIDTLGAVEQAEEIVRSGRARDAKTVDRMRELLEAHADIEPILAT